MDNLDIKVYWMRGCKYCTQAKLYLDVIGVPYEAIEVPLRAQREAYYQQWTIESAKAGWNEIVDSMPQIFIDGDRLGGAHDLKRSGLDGMIQAARAHRSGSIFATAVPLAAPLPTEEGAGTRRAPTALTAATIPVDRTSNNFHLWQKPDAIGNVMDWVLRWNPKTQYWSGTIHTTEKLLEDGWEYKGEMQLVEPPAPKAPTYG
jgi:glutaredoxin